MEELPALPFARGFTEDIIQKHVSFLFDIHSIDASDDLGLYEIPFGDLQKAQVFHLLHWPPLKPGQRAFSSLDFEAYTLKILEALFPRLRHGDFFLHDYYCKRLKIQDEITGKRKTDQELYGSDSKLQLHERYTKALLEGCGDSVEVICIWGGVARKFIERQYHIPRAAEPYRIERLEIGGIEVSTQKGESIHGN